MQTSAGAHIGMSSNTVTRTKDPATIKAAILHLRTQLVVKSNSIKSKLHRGKFLHWDKSQKQEKYQISRACGYYIQRGPREDNKDSFLLAPWVNNTVFEVSKLMPLKYALGWTLKWVYFLNEKESLVCIAACWFHILIYIPQTKLFNLQGS